MTIPPYIVLYKKRGQTPLETIEAWKAANPEFSSIPATYAGRLDPMAEGKLLVLLGEECKRQGAYRGLDKEYVVEIVFDLTTDSSDVLGLPAYRGTQTRVSTNDIEKALRAVIGSHTIPYPAFSSKTVEGKPLFLHMLEGTLASIQIPTHTETIYRAKMLGLEEISLSTLQEQVTNNLLLVPSSTDPRKQVGQDFRQDEIREQWKQVFETMPERTFSLVTLRVTCASGTYMRTLAGRLAKELGTTAFALSINRTRIGAYRLLGPFGFWSRQYT